MPESNDVSDSMRRMLGLSQMQLSDDEPPRRVDKELLRQLHTAGITDDLLHWEIGSLIGRYRVWAEAEKEVLFELLKEDGDILEDEETKMAHGEGLQPPAIADSIWLVDGIDWQELKTHSAVAVAIFLTATLCARMGVRPIRGRRQIESEVPDDMGLLLKDINAELSSGMPATLAGEGRWLHLRVRGDCLEVRVGRNAADRFQSFRLEFRRGKDVLVYVEAHESVAVLTWEHLRIARQGQADQLLILL